MASTWCDLQRTSIGGYPVTIRMLGESISPEGLVGSNEPFRGLNLALAGGQSRPVRLDYFSHATMSWQPLVSVGSE